MALGKPNNNESNWISFSDIMTGLMVIFMFIAISYIAESDKQQKEKDEIITSLKNSQKNLFKDIFIYPSNTKVVGPINFGGRAIEIKKSTRLKVAIFDSPPFKIGAYFGFSTSNGLGLNEPNVHIDFLNDIVEVFEKFNVEFYFKPKRQRNKNLEVESYLATIKKHQFKNNFHILNGDIAASYVIENSDLVVSFPFTSTGVIGKVLEKYSLYYDPTGKVSKEDKARHGLPLLSKKNELNKWVTQNIIEFDNK